MKNPKIDRCITRMVLGQPFYAALALRLKRVEDNTSKTAFWTDGITLAYNPAKVDELRDDQVMGAVCRLVEGLAHCHHTRRESRDAKTFPRLQRRGPIEACVGGLGFLAAGLFPCLQRGAIEKC